MDINNLSLRSYLREVKSHSFYLGILLIVVSTIIWSFYPTNLKCCDSLAYWQTSDDLSLMSNGEDRYRIRTFFYPVFIYFARIIPQSLSLGNNAEQQFLIQAQLLLHYIATLTLGYAVRLVSSRLYLCIFIYVFGLNFFLIALTNQVLTDSIAVSFLSISLSLFVITIINASKKKTNNLLIIVLSLLLGVLPMIRPSLLLISLCLYFILIFSVISRFTVDIKYFIYLLVSVLAFSCPFVIQIFSNSEIIRLLQILGKYHAELSSYSYKYITIIQKESISKEIAIGSFAINNSMKQLIDVCKISYPSDDCVTKIFVTNPIIFLSHYLIKIFAVNDQVYLTPYVNNFFAPERQLFRLINCIFLTLSVSGGFLIFKNIFKNNLSRKLFWCIISISLTVSLITPLVISVPEERFGLVFYPFFALGTSYSFYKAYHVKKNVDNLSCLVKPISVFLILVSLLFLLSLKIESTFRINFNG
jgi:hypothetical protein